MLLKALLTRLNNGGGVKYLHSAEGHRRTAKSTYIKYPQLAIILEKLLASSCIEDQQANLLDQMSRQVQAAFPAMEIIDRIGVRPEREPVIEAWLLEQLGNPAWTLRQKSARTLNSFINRSVLIKHFNYKLCTAPLEQNYLHGLLLCLKSIPIRGKKDLGKLNIILTSSEISSFS
jgi:hypothetical protein